MQRGARRPRVDWPHSRHQKVPPAGDARRSRGAAGARLVLPRPEWAAPPHTRTPRRCAPPAARRGAVCLRAGALRVCVAPPTLRALPPAPRRAAVCGKLVRQRRDHSHSNDSRDSTTDEDRHERRDMRVLLELSANCSEREASGARARLAGHGEGESPRRGRRTARRHGGRGCRTLRPDSRVPSLSLSLSLSFDGGRPGPAEGRRQAP